MVIQEKLGDSKDKGDTNPDIEATTRVLSNIAEAEDHKIGIDKNEEKIETPKQEMDAEALEKLAREKPNSRSEMYEKRGILGRAAHAYEEAGNYEKAAEIMNEFGSDGTDDVIRLYEKAGNYEKAAKFVEYVENIQTHPDKVKMGKAWEKAGNYEKALENYESSIHSEGQKGAERVRQILKDIEQKTGEKEKE